LLGNRFQRRLREPGAHAARPRHSCRLRPTEVGDPKAQRPRAHGAPRHGDDGLAVALFFRLFVIAFGYLFGALPAGAVLIIATLPAGSLDGNLDHADWLILWWAILPSAAIVAALAFLPAMVVILIAESLALRSLFFYVLSGGVGGLLYGLTFP